ncbi:hypothetical protein [Methylobacterium persicinum]|uniref:DUF962 domain-containing protein n=1 Tax=Methylobacterium persicinum TaxID=374426 RepID=A0ABU0HEX7_9HYPH|nr:hypothetical protein [Methylobacterium persicinum]MDQ0440867.1 hypothetical protein [Methylobacterium persicinum]GJE39666.1 hypothetical protein KHHGKMAE_3750 [Methylobacterium persicinum]
MASFREALRIQRWDDHRYYHHNLINQSLHMVSAICFLVAYVLAFKDPAKAALVGWLLAMTSRQAGHLFFEPKGYDHVNQATHEHKEEIKVGYNLQRKIVLLSIWVLCPAPLYFDPTFFGLLNPAQDLSGVLHNVGWIWLWLAIGGLLFRVGQLWIQQSAMTGVVWATKILTDPFHDIKLYHRAPLKLLQGELIDEEEQAEHHA